MQMLSEEYQPMSILKCYNCNTIIAKLEKPLPKEAVSFCSDKCDGIHNGKLSTMVLRYRGLA